MTDIKEAASYLAYHYGRLFVTIIRDIIKR